MICCRPCCAIISTFDVSGFFSSAARTRAAEFFVYWWMWAGGGVSPSNVLEVGPRRAALGRDWSPGLFAEKAPPACPSRAKAQSMGRVKIWFTSTSYSQGSRALRNCFSSFSDPAKRWMR